jgi:F-type H+-transporting ATPase subunit delta
MTEAREHLEEVLGSSDVAEIRAVSGDLLRVARLLGGESGLARSLADPAMDSEARLGLVNAVFGQQLRAVALEVLTATVGLRWSSSRDLVDGVELLGVQAAFTASAATGELDDVEDELFRFARIVERSPGLTSALADPAVQPDEKAALVRGLLADKATATTVDLVTSVMAALRGRAPVRALDELALEAAARHDRRIAVARVAFPLDDDLRARLETAVGQAVGHDVRLQVEVDPVVVGGIVVRVGDEVFDASVAHRLAQVGRALTP